MSFLYPLGLLGLIGIPIVIIIYILRSKYNEQTVTSTYIWKLSEKFLKRKNPLSGLTGLISLILQILTIAAISFAVAKPIFVLPGAAYDYYFVLDASGSMNMENGSKTRFELAQEEIERLIKRAADGSTYTLITVAGEEVTVFENVTNKTTAIEAMERLSAGYESHDYSEILKTAQTRFDDNSSALIYVLTDKNYQTTENVEVIDVGGEDVDNYAIFNVTYSQTGGTLKVDANVISYASNQELTVNLYLEDSATSSANTTVQVKAGELTPVSLQCQAEEFSSFTTTVANEDGYAVDNKVVTHNLKSDKTYSTIIVSDTGFFLEAVLDALINVRVDVVTPKNYDADPTAYASYGLYIFDSYTPSELPDGAVWLINSATSVENSGFGVRGKVELGEPETIQKSTSTSSSVRKMLEGVDGSEIYIKNYIKYSGMYLNFSTLFSYNSNPLVFVGANALGNRQAVIGFDLHESDFALTVDFVMLLRNLVEYSFPDVVESSHYVVGEEVYVNMIANAENVKAISPTGKEVYMESDGIYATLGLTEVGTYTVQMRILGVETQYRIYSGPAPEESKPNVAEAEFSLSGERGYEKRDGQFDPTLVLFICIALFVIADWGVYCYEKYQLR